MYVVEGGVRVSARLTSWIGQTPRHERVPDVVDLNPIDAWDSTCMGRGEILSAGQFPYVV